MGNVMVLIDFTWLHLHERTRGFISKPPLELDRSLGAVFFNETVPKNEFSGAVR